MIEKEEIQHIAKLARLGISDPDKFKKDLSSILDYFNTLNEADVSEIEPTFHPSEIFSKDFLREDEAEKQETETIKRIIEAAPAKKDGFVKVKTVL